MPNPATAEGSSAQEFGVTRRLEAKANTCGTRHWQTVKEIQDAMIAPGGSSMVHSAAMLDSSEEIGRLGQLQSLQTPMTNPIRIEAHRGPEGPMNRLKAAEA